MLRLERNFTGFIYLTRSGGGKCSRRRKWSLASRKDLYILTAWMSERRETSIYRQLADGMLGPASFTTLLPSFTLGVSCCLKFELFTIIWGRVKVPGDVWTAPAASYHYETKYRQQGSSWRVSPQTTGKLLLRLQVRRRLCDLTLFFPLAKWLLRRVVSGNILFSAALHVFATWFAYHCIPLIVTRIRIGLHAMNDPNNLSQIESLDRFYLLGQSCFLQSKLL